MQAFFHLVNSGSNLFIYLLVSPKFRKSALKSWRMVWRIEEKRNVAEQTTSGQITNLHSQTVEPQNETSFSLSMDERTS